MRCPEGLTYYRGRWPDAEVPEGEAEWVLWEVSLEQDAVLRSVAVHGDGRRERSSVEFEQRDGDHCPSLIDCSLREAMADAPLREIARSEFEDAWERGVDTPLWFV